MRRMFLGLLVGTGLFVISPVAAQQSVARQWNEALLEAIRNDFARPTVHARNLFHTSVLLYDAWATYHPSARTYFMGKVIGGYRCSWGEVAPVTDTQAAQEEAMSFAAYRLLSHRFQNSPGVNETIEILDDLMSSLGYDLNQTSTDYINGPPAAVGNYMAQCMIQFGLTDGANEINEYGNLYYQPINPPMIINNPGNPNIIDYNRWQPLTLDLFIDQSGNPIAFNTPEFLSPEWGKVIPFALTANDLTIYQREEQDELRDYQVYYDPGAPPYIDIDNGGDTSDQYRWGFGLVSVWSSHLDPSDGVMWDISPATIGNITSLPTTDAQQRAFYDLLNGGDASVGHQLNPVTGQPYAPQMVPRGDYARVLAEFWADGPDSETPPGHWFVILNYVNDHPMLEKRFKGEGEVLNDLEWDVKSYFLLSGAMHDAAITAWGIKGWYDYIRPVSAIRGMAELGQSTDPGLPNFHPGGLELIPGYIELVSIGDPLAGASNEHAGKIKLLAWRGPNFVIDPATDVAGVDWILAENWWPYQRPSFVTPPFAGYVSGHSTYSRAAAEVLTLLTGDPFFPGGIGEFEAEKDNFLVFERGPSVDITLQWATYRDASDQTSLSRIWGGIHPPADDIPGRIIGEQIGINAFNKGEKFFNGLVTSVEDREVSNFKMYPNPARPGSSLSIVLPTSAANTSLQLLGTDGKTIWQKALAKNAAQTVEVPLEKGLSGLYFIRWIAKNQTIIRKVVISDG